MKKIGILFGQENSFPQGFFDRVNQKAGGEMQAEFVRIDKVVQGEPCGYDVIVDRTVNTGDTLQTRRRAGAPLECACLVLGSKKRPILWSNLAARSVQLQKSAWTLIEAQAQMPMHVAKGAGSWLYVTYV